MTGCFPCVGNIKHATLIKNCYPSIKEGGTSPRSSELSYLTFYASSRPAKLTKVGSFLQKKVARDIKKGRKSHNQASLQILKALIQTCHRDLNIFSKHVVKILSLLLDTRDLELIDLTCETFIVFCSYHDGTTLGVDQEFTSDYETLITKFSGFCNYTNEDEALALKMRYIGHRAVQAAVTSSALQLSNFTMQLSILFPPLIVTLASSSKSLHAIGTSNGTIDIRDSALDNGKISTHVIELLAAHTISILFNKVTGPSVRLSLVPLFDYMNEKEKWWPPHLAVNIMKLVLESLQPQYRYLLVSYILHQLDLNQENNANMINDKHASLISILDTILNANIPLVGISVLEVLNSLFNFLVKTTQYHPFPSPPPPSQQQHEDDADEKIIDQYATVIQHGLVHSIGGLASQIYYENQLNDMIGYLISKLRTNTALEYVDNILIHDYRLIVLHCLDSIVDASHKENSVMSSSEAAAAAYIEEAESRFPLDAWNPALGLLSDKNARSRIAFSKSLYNFLQNMTPKVKSNPTDKYPQHSSTSHHDAVFIDRFVHAIQDWISISDFNVTDLRFVYSFLCMLTYKFGIDATVMIVPLLFYIQQLIKEGKITQTSRQYAIESSLISLLNTMAQFYHIESLSKYMNELKDARKDDILLTESINISSINEPELFEIHVTDQEEKVNRTWIDRSIVVEIMSKEGNLRDEQDTHGLELEAKLFAEWGSDAFLKNDQTIRSKRILQELNEKKPKLSSPWEHADLIRNPAAAAAAASEENKKNSNTIRVATLKEALVAQNISGSNEDDVDSDSTQTNSLSAHSKPPRINADMNALLTELNLPQITQSTVSLVNPPYKST